MTCATCMTSTTCTIHVAYTTHLTCKCVTEAQYTAPALERTRDITGLRSLRQLHSVTSSSLLAPSPPLLPLPPALRSVAHHGTAFFLSVEGPRPVFRDGFAGHARPATILRSYPRTTLKELGIRKARGVASGGTVYDTSWVLQVLGTVLLDPCRCYLFISWFCLL